MILNTSGDSPDGLSDNSVIRRRGLLKLSGLATAASGIGALSWPAPKADAAHTKLVPEIVPRSPAAGAILLNVRDYGAAGDGIKDDTAAIASAVAAISSMGAVLHFPAGSYLHYGVVIDGKSNFEITGPGELVAAKAWQLQYIKVVNCTDFCITGIGSRHQSPTVRRSSPARCFSLEGCIRFSISNCHAHNGEGIGIMLKNCCNGTVTGNIVNNTKADGIGLYNNTHHLTVSGNTTRETGDDGIAQVGVMSDGFQPHDIAITGNVVERSRARGIVIGGAYNSSISGNVVDTTTAGGIYIACESGRGLYGSHDITVTGNTVINANRLEPSINQAGISVLGTSDTPEQEVTDVSIVGNRVIDAGYHAMQIGNSSGDATCVKRVAVKNNEVVRTGVSGVEIASGVDITVTGNNFTLIGSHAVWANKRLSGFLRFDNNNIRRVNTNSGSTCAAIDLSLATATGVCTIISNIIVDSPSSIYGVDAPPGAIAYGNIAEGLGVRGPGAGSVNHRGNIALSASAAAASTGGGAGVIAMRNAAAAPSINPGNGGVLYTESGALKYRGSNGTITTIAPA